jgi:multiple sugar transport system substrate-binding protein
MWVRAVILVAALALAPLGARAADLVVWWDEGFYAQEAEAAAKVVAAFEQTTGRQVQVVFHPQDELPDRIAAALAAGQPPDFVFGLNLPEYIAPWAFDDRLVDLSDAIGPFSDLFDPDVLDQMRLLNGRTGKRALYGLPVGRSTNHLHVWTSLLKQAGFTLADIPKEWEAFWAFWCDTVQPAVRRATGRDDIYSIGLPMSVETTTDTWFEVLQFVAAYEANYVTPEAG